MAPTKERDGSGSEGAEDAAGTSASRGAGISIRVNGVDTAVTTGIYLAQWLESAGYEPLAVAVEHNGEIVPKQRFGDVQLQDGDKLEVVGFVQGG